MAKRELYGTASCAYTRELCEWLEWRGREFVEYDVESDEAALMRLCELTGERVPVMVPVLVEDGRVAQVGWQGRGCVVRAHVQS